MRKDKDLEDIKNGKGLTDVIINDEKHGSLLIERKKRSKGINESVAKRSLVVYRRSGKGTTTVLRAAPECKKIPNNSAKKINRELIEK